MSWQTNSCLGSIPAYIHDLQVFIDIHCIMRDQKDLFTIKVLSHIQRLGHQMTQPDKNTQEITSESWVASNATIQGDVTLNSQANIWFGAVLRGDEAPITIGAGTNVQDNAVIHVSKDFPVVLGKHVTVGHGAILHGCTIDDNTLIGMGAIVLDGAHIGSNCLIGAGALITEGTVIPDGYVAFGNPARLIRKLSPEEAANNLSNAIHYIELAATSLPQWQQ